jgi:hypothetical protein
MEFDAFRQEHRHFLLYGPTPTWITTALLSAGARLVLLGQDSGETPFAMTSPGPSSLFDVSFDVGNGHGDASASR